jgi:hypothetical protein
MLQVGFGPMIQTLERVKTFRTLNRAATVIDNTIIYRLIMSFNKPQNNWLLFSTVQTYRYEAQSVTLKVGCKLRVSGNTEQRNF